MSSWRPCFRQLNYFVPLFLFPPPILGADVTMFIITKQGQPLLFLLVILASKYYCHMATYSRSSWLTAIFSCRLNHSFLDNWKNSPLSKYIHFLTLPLNNFTVRNGYIAQHNTLLWHFVLGGILICFSVDPLSFRQASILTQSSSVIRTPNIIALLGHAIISKLISNSTAQHILQYPQPKTSMTT